MKHALVLTSLLFCLPAWAQNPVTVHIVNADNAPVAGASVDALMWDGEKRVSRAGETDQNGDVTLDLPLVVGEKAAAGLTVAAKGYAFAGAVINKAKTEVTLEKGSVWRGRVTDENGKALEGARVTLNGAMGDKDGKRRASLYSTRFIDLFTATSAADGSFAIADVPATGLYYGVLCPGYARGRGQDISAEGVTRITLVPGGAFKGKLLGIGGKPLPKVRIFAQATGTGDGYGDTRTAEDGSFTLDNLAIEEYNVMVDEPDGADYIVAAQQKVQAQKGVTLELPNFQAVPGVIISGTVRDAATKKGVAGATIGVQGPNRPPGSAAVSTSGLTGADGKFTVRVLPGRNMFYFNRAPQGYPRSNEQRTVEVPAQAPEPLLFEVKAVTPLRGKIVDEAGKPVAATIRMTYDDTITSGADGKWEYKPTEQTALQLSGGDGKDEYFEVIRPRVIDAFEPGDTTIVVRRKPWQVLPGRALDSEGNPIEGVRIDATFFVSQGNDGGLAQSTRTATTNANGDFVLPQMRADGDAQYLTLKAQKGGYAFQSGGEVGKNGPVWKTSDFIFTALNRKIEGVTEPGAHLVAAGQEAVANEQGQFVFDGLPTKNVLVFAARNGSFGGGEVTEPLKIELKKQELQGYDPALAKEIWTDLSNQAAGKKFYSIDWVKNQLAATDGDFETQAKAAGTDNWALVALGEKWVGRVPTVQLQQAFDKITEPDFRLYAYLSAATKGHDTDLGQKALELAQITFATPEKEKVWREMNLYRAAVVATKFEGEPAGFAALDKAIAFTLKNHSEKSRYQDGQIMESGQDDMFAMQCEVVAEGSPALFQRLYSNLEAGEGYDIQAVSSAIPVLAKNFGLEVALPLLDQLEKLPVPVLDAKSQVRRADHQTPYAFSQAASRLVPMFKNSPEKALELARRVTESSFQSKALASAAHFQTGEAAAKLWTETVQRAMAEDAPRYAARAWNEDHALGEKLFDVALEKVKAESQQEWRGRGLWGSYAFYLAPLNPAEARLLIEREWAIATQKKSEGNTLDELARAMSAIDGRRAWEMARSIPNDGNFAWGLESQRKVGQYVATPLEKRKDWPFSRWSRSDTWDGGEE